MKENASLNEIKNIENALRVLLVPATPGEYDLHALVSCALEKAGFSFEHEKTLAPCARVDFCVNRIGIEVKKGKPDRSSLIKQITKYLASDELDAMIVVTQRSVYLPLSVLGKPVSMLSLDKLWGVSLP